MTIRPLSVPRSLRRPVLLFIWGVVALAAPVKATQTENFSLRVLPAPGPVKIDGRTSDWDLSGGMFACDNVEELRDRFAVWFHAMYDRTNLYLLARFTDPTPLNNPGQVAGDNGFEGDCLQFRMIFDAGSAKERVLHFTAWRDREGADVVKVEQGRDLKGPTLPDAKVSAGVVQAFELVPKRPGYNQEIAIPWKFLTGDGRALGPGDSFTMTIEPNFYLDSRRRFSLKDLFKEGVQPDRVFTFRAYNSWGTAHLDDRSSGRPQPLRLADGTEIPARMEGAEPVLQWTAPGLMAEPKGVKQIAFEMPFDGAVSLHVRDVSGRVVSQVLNAASFAKGSHSVTWNGLTTPSWTRPGEVLPPGDYQWAALVSRGLGLKFRGWADNAGSAPWDGATGRENWGGDHGVPSAVAADESQVYLGWSGAEAGKSVLACDLRGGVLWNNNRGGIAGVKALAAGGGVVYVLGGTAGIPANGGNLYRLDARSGAYLVWPSSGGPDLTVAALWPSGSAVKPAMADTVVLDGSAVVLGFHQERLRAWVDAVSGRLLKTDKIEGEPRIIADRAGVKCVATGAPGQQVQVYLHGSKSPARLLGRIGGRPPSGPWQADSFQSIVSLALDSDQKLWVAESGPFPKRISVWDPTTGKLLREFFGPSSYGALGGAIHPADPGLMVGQGCEWRIDPKTGRATCLGVITQDGMENSRFGVGTNGRVYLAVAGNWQGNTGPLRIFERVGDGDYRLRTEISLLGNNGQKLGLTLHGKESGATATAVWSDENGDGEQQADEVVRYPGEWRFSGWYMNFGPDLSLFAKTSLFKVAGFTAAGAPKYDLSKPTSLPAPGFVSADSRLVLEGGNNNVVHSAYTCYDIATGQRLWSYPDNFTGVHGSHNAPPPAIGLIRGSFGPCGSATLPAPIGNIWAIPTNVGEWHLLSEAGFYLGRLFEPDPLKVEWPANALPGADMSHAPPGAGGEDFGGSIALDRSGRLLVQAGKTAFWNLEVTGLDTVRPLAGSRVTLTEADVAQATRLREALLQQDVGVQKITAKKATPRFSGDLGRDFGRVEWADFQKGPDTKVRAAIAWDENALHLGWQVTDSTPWTNGAETAESLYTGGDTVDFQLATNPKADPKRAEAVEGDLRLSIGNLKGTPTAVLFRPVASGPGLNPKTFSSGVVSSYIVADVKVLTDATLKVTRQNGGYTVEASIPLGDLGWKPSAGSVVNGDFGVTYGDPAGRRTRLRNYWNNRHTGLVDDAVFELRLEPRNWGKITLQP